MITREDFKVKLREWLSEETCERLAYEAEQRFAETDDMSVYELMLVRIASGDTADFIDMCDECDIKLNADDDIDGMYADMVDEW